MRGKISDGSDDSTSTRPQLSWIHLPGVGRGARLQARELAAPELPVHEAGMGRAGVEGACCKEGRLD